VVLLSVCCCHLSVSRQPSVGWPSSLFYPLPVLGSHSLFSIMHFETDRDDAAARNRVLICLPPFSRFSLSVLQFENFKLGNGAPPIGPSHRHSRSHSRNTSVSSFSFPPSKTTTVNDLSQLSSFTSNPPPLLSTPIATPSPSPTALSHPIPPSKRNSHHRRRSSVSTRHESAEMMGVALPNLPQSTSDDNINLGEKDSIRRRALWALEGKPDVSFNKVEIPDISTPDIEKMMFDFGTYLLTPVLFVIFYAINYRQQVIFSIGPCLKLRQLSDCK